MNVQFLFYSLEKKSCFTQIFLLIVSLYFNVDSNVFFFFFFPLFCHPDSSPSSSSTSASGCSSPNESLMSDNGSLPRAPEVKPLFYVSDRVVFFSFISQQLKMYLISFKYQKCHRISYLITLVIEESCYFLKL